MYVIVHVFGLAGPLVSKTSSGRIVASPILVWSYLLLAVNSAMVGQYAIEMTAARILQISRRISPMHPHQVVERLQAYLWLAAIGETVLTLLPARYRTRRIPFARLRNAARSGGRAYTWPAPEMALPAPDHAIPRSGGSPRGLPERLWLWSCNAVPAAADNPHHISPGCKYGLPPGPILRRWSNQFACR